MSALRVSVVLPAYFSQTTLALCLQALRRQTRPPDEIIVVNSSPEGETGALVAAHFPEVIFEQSPARLLPHAARNRGVELASGDVLVFSDPDCEADPGWLAALLVALGEGHACLVGAMDVARDEWREWGVHLCKFHGLLPGLPPGDRVHAPTANTCFTRSLWARIGPFPDLLFCGDGVLALRAAAAGHPPRFVPDAVVKHHHDLDLLTLCRQRFARGQEYGQTRLEREDNAWPSTLASLVGSPATLPWVLGRAGLDAARAGWAARFLATLPTQALGHALWSWGECAAGMRSIAGRMRRAKSP